MSNDLKNMNFVQFNRKAMASHRQLIMKSQLGAAILDFLVERMDRNNAVVCSYKVLQEITGYSRASIGRAMKVLKEDNWIQTVKIGSATAYLVNSAAFWSTYANGKKYSLFHATVIASAEEQQETEEALEKLELNRVTVLQNNEMAVIGNEELPPPDQKDLDV